MDTDTLVANPTSIRERIDEALESLSNLANAKRSRSDIIADLAKDLSEYYGYIEELSAFLLDLFSPSECVEYMDASDRPRPLVIRTNTLKTTRKDLMEALGKRGAALEAIDWSKVAIKVTESSVPIGATPEYLAGYYMLQSAASLNPVMALAPLPGEKVLDMSAAPGGKTSYIAQLMKNSGTVIANDLKPQRQKATVANLHRLGVKNTTVCCYDGRKINQIFKGFDRVLLDAPCSGLGVISRDQSVKLQRTVKDIQRIAHLQKELLRAAVDAVDPKSPTGGIIVYSTCSISTEENEQVVDYILQKRFVRLIDTGLEVGKPGLTRHMEKRFHPSLALTRRFYPHVHNMDGFYVAKFQKYANGVRGEEDGNDEDEEEEGEYDSDGNSIHHSEEGSEMDVEESEEESSDDEEEEVPPPPPAKKSGKKDSKHPEPVAPPAPVVPAKKETPPAAASVKKDAAPVAASKKVESKAETVKPSAASAKESADKKAPAAETKAAVPISISPKISKVNIKQPVKEVVKEEEEKPVAVAAPVAASSGSKRSAKAEPEKEPSSSSSSNKKVKKVEPEPSSSEESDDDEDEEEEEEVQVPRRIGKRMSIKELRRVMTLKKALSKK